MKKIITAVSVAALAISLASCSSVKDNEAAAPVVTESATPVAPSASASATSAAPASLCKPTTVTGHEPKNIAPPTKVRASLPKTFTLKTNCGDIEITTVGSKAPYTLTSLATLAEGGFYDGSLCHRLTTQGLFVLQCGDPTATGSGGPTYSVSDENLPQAVENNYPAGTVAMANSGPNTNGSQFFLVFGDTTLGAAYSIWGTITKGLDIVQAIAAAGVAGGGGDGTPALTVAINKVVVK